MRRERTLVRVHGDARSTGYDQAKIESEHKVKRAIGNGVERCGWGIEWFCSSVRSTLFPVPNPQEDKIKEMVFELYSVETQWNPKRTEQRTNYYMS